MTRLACAALAALTIAALATPALAFGLPKLTPRPSDQARGHSAPAPKLALGAWPQAQSDLKADPDILFGALPNGMRYAIMRNATPPGQASLRLYIGAGSLMERDDQQGLAHFLEHMAFNGSKAVPNRGEMVEILQRHGLAFGPDTNAQTDFDNTIYKLDLPKTDEDTLDTGLMLLRETAGNLTLAQKAMDEERGVILSEQRMRDTPSYRVTKARIGFLMAGQLPPKRFPIGLTSVIQNANRDKIAEFYASYYRPERATLIAVGDFDPKAMEAKIKARFSDWRGVGPAGSDPDLGRVERRGAAYDVDVEPGAPTSVELAWVTAPDLSADTFAKRKREWIERLGLAVLNRRLATLARADNPPFIAAAAFRGDELRTEEVTGLLADAQPDHWKAALAAAETEVRRAVKYGVRPDELAREITEQEAALKLAAAGAATRPTTQLADAIAGTLGEETVQTSPADDLALFETVTKNLAPETVSAALKRVFQGSGPLIFLSSGQAVDGGEKALRIAFDEAKAQPVTPPAKPRQVDWPYTDFGTPGKIAERKDILDLDTVFIRFQNGVRLTIKPTKFRQDQVLVKVRFGDGLEGLSPDHQALTWAGGAFAEGGFAKISANDAERALAGKEYAVGFGAEDDAFALTGDTRSSDIGAQMQVLAAYVAHPGWRPAAFDRMKTYGETLESQFQATDSGVLNRDLAGLMHAGDRRWTFPTAADISAETPADLESELAPALASGPIEVIVVGDITVDKAIEAVAETFGALPMRPAPAAPRPPAHPPAFPAPTPTPLVETDDGRPDQAIGYIAWPTTGYFADPQGARIDAILGEVLELRMIDKLRLAEGVTYSPRALYSASTVWPHWGFISAQVEEPPGELGGFFSDIDDIAASLKAAPVSRDELERAKKPKIDELEKATATNAYWLAGLSGAQADPRRLDILRSAEAGLERVSAADVQKAARTWLRGDKAWKLIIEPKPKAAPRQGRNAPTSDPPA
ncbi:MAG TPA: insulinase family protein [Caulobacteraceae bacterium]|nr:insulinase family protein [Caulobacteraceae bacterium]